MASSIWKNEISTFKKIADEARKGRDVKTNFGYMLESGDLSNNQRSTQRANLYRFLNPEGKQLLFSESHDGKIQELSYQFDNSGNTVSITYDDAYKQIAYHLHSGPYGHNLLAIVSRNGAEIPVYGSKMESRTTGLLKFEQIGVLPEIEQGDTVRECIEKTLLSHPVLNKEANLVLNSFDHILSVDKNREIKPKTPEEIERANLKNENATLQNENGVLSGKNAELSDENAELQAKIAKMESEISSLKAENKKQSDLIDRLQEMVDKLTKLGLTIKNKFLGKIFFRKALEEAGFSGKKGKSESLPEGEGRDIL